MQDKDRAREIARGEYPDVADNELTTTRRRYDRDRAALAEAIAQALRAARADEADRAKDLLGEYKAAYHVDIFPNPDSTDGKSATFARMLLGGIRKRLRARAAELRSQV